LFLLSSVPVEPERYQESQTEAERKRENKEWPPDVAPVRQRFVVMAIDRDSGSLIWSQTSYEGVPSESHYVDSSWASGSPVTDGEVLIAHFGSNGTYAYDLDGKLLWQTDLGDMKTRNGFGEGSSAAIHQNRVIINWDHEGDSFIVALDKRTGEEIWRTPRPGEVTSWATPLVITATGRTQIIVPATGRSRGYDVESGAEIWSLAGMTVNTIPSPVHRDGLVYLASGYRGEALQAVDLETASGAVEGTPALVWEHDRHTPYVPSLLLYDNQIYFIKHFKNILTSVRADTGVILFTEIRIDGISSVWASPVGAAGRVYILGRNGTTAVLEHGPEYKVLSTNELDDRFDATPALVDNEIFLRGMESLYKIVESQSDP
jgi:outer membrane protein assembly factor BamB